MENTKQSDTQSETTESKAEPKTIKHVKWSPENEVIMV